VAQEIKTNKREDLFAATPPLEAKKLLFSFAVTEGIGFVRGQRANGMKLDFIDIRRAYFHALARRKVYVKLCKEDYEVGMCGRLNKAMYGTRDAAQNWEFEYVEFMVSVGFSAGKVSPCVFFNKERNIRVVVHGDDFTCLGNAHDLDWFRNQIIQRYEVKFRGRLGPGAGDDKSIRILNRVVTWTADGIQYEADQRHAEILINEMGFETSTKSVVAPGVKMSSDELSKCEATIPEHMITKYRACAARAMYLAQDRSDIGFAVKEVSRGMAAPTEGDLSNLKKLCRYLIDKERMVTHYNYQDAGRRINIWSDTDYAGGVRTRKSTTGGVCMIGDHIVKSWCTTQAVIALSSGEAEYYGLVKGSSIGLGIRGIMADLGVSSRVKVMTDSSAAKGISARKGVGRVRHIEVNQLWVQDKVRSGDIEIVKVDGDKNLGDALTKYLDANDTLKHCEGTGQYLVVGERHPLMPLADYTRK